MIALAAGDPIEVHVQSDPDIRTTVGADGTFTLRGLPEEGDHRRGQCRLEGKGARRMA